MYLSKKNYVQNWNFQKPEHRHEIIVKKGGEIRTDINPERITYVVEQVAYWRKFNALHNWFVQNCGKGEDDCKEVYVPREALVELLEGLKQIKESLDKSTKVTREVEVGWANGEKIYDKIEVFENTDIAEDLLPPTMGFFFGTYDIDEWYYKDVCNTINIFEELVKDEHGEYYYQASW